LGEVIEQVNERNFKENDYPVLSISNFFGFVQQEEYFSLAVHSEDTKGYKIVRRDYFGYNPARINVGSVLRPNHIAAVVR
jgi:type I restriction enzyme S subunit